MIKEKIKPIPKHVKKKIISAKRHLHHPELHHIRKKYKISKKTMFYMKEYGPRSHVSHVIVKESFKILILASVISSIGGIGLHSIEGKILGIIPLIILLPALNDMIGDYGTIVASKFTTMLYLGKVKRSNWWKSKSLHELLHTIITVAVISAIYIGILSSFLAYYLNKFPITPDLILKVLGTSIFATMILTGLIFFVSITLGFYFYSKKEDPDNFLIPISTSIADLGSMVIYSGIIVLFF